MGFPNAEQISIIEALEGAFLVLAPAGTGKTRVMAERLSRAIENGYEPRRTLGVTFTNRAADEISSRVANRLGKVARNVNIFTFHGLCAWILKHEAVALGIHWDFIIYDEEDSKEVLRYCLSGRSMNANDAYWRLSQMKSNASLTELSLTAIPPIRIGNEDADLRNSWAKYHEILAERNALDFADLIYKVRSSFALLPETRERWERRFDWIQVDEIQDTHGSEYDVVNRLALRSRNLSFFGDIDQTIYEWRGSNPDSVIQRFKLDFAPVKEFSLARNFRATKSLLRVADRFADTFQFRRTRIRPADSLPAGEPVLTHCASDPGDEARWIAEQIKLNSRSASEGNDKIGILTRTHNRSQVISLKLSQEAIPHITVEQFQFFLRQEIKDIIARLRLLLNPSDTGALGRIVRRPASRIGKETLKRIWQEGEAAALRLTDMVRPDTHRFGEPFAPLLTALERGTVVVLDVETTGLSPADDDVVDVGAVRIKAGKVTEAFECLVRPSKPVGGSEEIHGLSDAILLEKGREPARALAELRDFVGGAHVVGHNIRFDLSMLNGQSTREDIDFDISRWDDTLDIAKRVLSLGRFDLGTLCEHFNTAYRPSHRALADARATAEILMKLRNTLVINQIQRKSIVSRHARQFLHLTDQLASWAEASEILRHAELAEQILLESGLGSYYAADARRSGYLKDFVSFFRLHDRLEVSPRSALEDLVRRVSLVKNVDHLDENDSRIPIITIHQAKGLEFDTVFVAGASNNEIPSYFAKRDNRVEEERRLFYVAITRAKRRLYVSSFWNNDQGFRAGPSEFVESMQR